MTVEIIKLETKLGDEFVNALKEGKYRITNTKITRDTFSSSYVTVANGSKITVDLVLENNVKVRIEAIV